MQRTTTKNLIKLKKKKGEIPRKCPHCRSSRIDIMNRKIEQNGEIITLKGWNCKRCGVQNCRRLKEEKE